jgi:hypothetical protein
MSADYICDARRSAYEEVARDVLSHLSVEGVEFDIGGGALLSVKFGAPKVRMRWLVDTMEDLRVLNEHCNQSWGLILSPAVSRDMLEVLERILRGWGAIDEELTVEALVKERDDLAKEVARLTSAAEVSSVAPAYTPPFTCGNDPMVDVLWEPPPGQDAGIKPSHIEAATPTGTPEGRPLTNDRPFTCDSDPVAGVRREPTGQMAAGSGDAWVTEVDGEPFPISVSDVASLDWREPGLALTRDQLRDLGTWALLRSMPEPDPADAEGDVLEEVIQREVEQGADSALVHALRQRRAFGIAKYGKPLSVGNGRDHLRDCLDEVLDAMAYAYASGDNHLYKYAKTAAVRAIWAIRDRA